MIHEKGHATVIFWATSVPDLALAGHSYYCYFRRRLPTDPSDPEEATNPSEAPGALPLGALLFISPREPVTEPVGSNQPKVKVKGMRPYGSPWGKPQTHAGVTRCARPRLRRASISPFPFVVTGRSWSTSRSRVRVVRGSRTAVELRRPAGAGIMSYMPGNVVSDAQLVQALTRYAIRVHRLAGDTHHVASPLGAWVLVALCSPLARGSVRDELVEVLGVEPEQAATFAGLLLEHRHPLVGSGAAVWNRPSVDTWGLEAWKTTLPGIVETGDILGQQALDTWANDRTMGFIKQFPLQVTPDVVLLMATALATKVSWARPFDLVPAATLGTSSPWSRTLDQVLRSPYGPEHPQFIADTKQAGRVAVHTARARGGLQVTSVIASEDVPALDVLAAADHIATSEAIEPGSVERCSPFDLPLGEDRFWTITEEEVQVKSADGREERFKSIMPAWSAESNLDLGDTTLGFPAAAIAMAEVLGLADFRYQARQAALARYTRVGFEAAAISAMAGRARAARPGIRRVAELRFGHRYATVAVTVDDARDGEQRGPWHGLPVFSAWITEPVDARE